MMRSALGLAAGLLFGCGLILAGMVNPAKVLGFLDLAGQWDASLAFVMAGGVAAASIGFTLGRSRAAPFLAPAFAVLAKGRPDPKLMAGAVLFGVGWGLAGLCPGPAITSLGLSAMGVVGWPVWLFAAAMLAGMAAHSAWQRATPIAGPTMPTPISR